MHYEADQHLENVARNYLSGLAQMADKESRREAAMKEIINDVPPTYLWNVALAPHIIAEAEKKNREGKENRRQYKWDRIAREGIWAAKIPWFPMMDNPLSEEDSFRMVCASIYVAQEAAKPGSKGGVAEEVRKDLEK